MWFVLIQGILSFKHSNHGFTPKIAFAFTMKGVYVQFYRAVLGELQFLRDDARPENNNCKLQGKDSPICPAGDFYNFGSSHCERSSFDNRGKTTEGIQSATLIWTSEAANFSRHQCSLVDLNKSRVSMIWVKPNKFKALLCCVNLTRLPPSW